MPTPTASFENVLRPLAPASRTTQVVDQLTQSILSGELSDATFLPPERNLAEHL
ncbi:MAG: GntR family transcriptional regulator, partial [Sphingobacteriales bacterium]